MRISRALIALAVVGVTLLALAYGLNSTDGGSKDRDSAIAGRVEKVESNVALAKGDPGKDGENGKAGTDGAKGKDGFSLIGFGKNGENGLACYDVNLNGIGDVEEDVNGDGEYDVLDCRGGDGAVGPQGPRGKPGFGLKIVLGKKGQDGKNGKDCTTGGTCEFYSVCCTDDGKPTATATAEPAKPTKPEPAKKPEKVKKNKKQKKDACDEPKVLFENKHAVTVKVNGDVVQEGEGSSAPAPATELPPEVTNNGGTVYINNTPVNVRIGD